jgi:nitric oxide reductase NorQ protein
MTVKKTVPAARKKAAAPARPSKAKQVAGKATDISEKAAALHPSLPSIAAVPDMSVADKYTGRSIGGKTDFELFDFCYETGTNLLIEGPTGCGKTMASRAWAALNHKMVARIPSNSGIDASQLFGKYNPAEEGGGFIWVDGPVTHVWRFGGLLLWNEINFTPERVGSVMFGSLDDNREIVLLDHNGEHIRAHRGAGQCWCDLDEDTCNDRRVLVVADQNPGYAGTRELNDALRNRFGMQLTWDYDPVVEASLISSDALRALAQQVRGDEGYETPVSTNMLMEFERMATALSLDFALTNFVNHFRSDEKEPIKLVLEAHKGGIEKELLSVPDEDDEDPEVTDNAATATVSDDDLAGWIFASDD